MSVVQGALRFANDHGPVALIAVAAIGFMAWLWMTSFQTMQATQQTQTDILNLHARDTAWYQRQTCIAMATLAGTQVALCDPPRDR